MKSSVPSNAGTNLLSDIPIPYVSEAAQKRLDALRSSVEIRLAALEAALADPSRGDALESLILDLSRVATEEAQAVATRACVDSRLTADVQIAQAKAAAQAAIEQERIASQTAFEEEHAAIIAAHQQELTTVKRALTNAQSALRGEQTKTAELAEARDRAQQQVITLEQALGDRTAALQAAGETAARQEREHADTRSLLAAEQSTIDDLRATASRAAEQLTALGRSEAVAREAHAELLGELERERAALNALGESHAELQRRDNDAWATIADLRRTVAHTEAQMATAIEAERNAIVELREAAGRDEAHVRATLEAERTAAGALRDAAARSEAQVISLEHEVAQARLACEGTQTALEQERRRTADLEHARTDATSQYEREHERAGDLEKVRLALQARLDAERDDASTFKIAAEQAALRLSALTSAASQTQLSADESRQALAFSRAEVQALRDDLETARARLERLAGEHADAERLWKQTDSQLTLAIRDRDAAIQALETLRQTPRADTPIAVAAPRSVPPEKPDRKDTEPPAASRTLADASEADWTMVRMSIRYGFATPIDLQINGGPGVLVNLSVGGCQVLSASPLKPNQSLKVVMPSEPKPLSCSGKVAWAKLEAPANGRPGGYRAGIQFTRADEPAIEAFILRHGGTA
jgi:chromosome segregation ATPase